MVTDYYFNFQAPITYEKDSYIYIEFPSEYETVTLSNVNLVFNKGLINTTSHDADYTLSSHLVTITFPVEVSSGAQFSIHMEDVKNPQALTATGSFKVYTRKVNDTRNSSENWAFDVLAFSSKWAGNVPGSITLDDAGTGYSQISNVSSNYYFKITIARDVDILTWFKITLPDGWSKQEGIDLDCGVTTYAQNQGLPTGTFQCRTVDDVIYLEGLGQNILVATDVNTLTFSLYIPNIVNPGYAVAKDAQEFLIDLIRPGTETVSYRYRCYTPLITAVTPTVFTWTQDSNYGVPINGNQLLGVFEFTTVHDIPEGGKIQIAVDVSTWVSDATHGCYIIQGPADKATNNMVTCGLSSNTLTVANFPDIPAATNIKLQVTVNIGVGTQDQFTLTTYDDSDRIIEQASITALVRTNTLGLMTNVSLDLPDAGKVKDKMIMHFQLNTALVANTGVIRFEFPPSITLNAINALPVCKYEPNGGTEQLFSQC